MAEAKLYNGVAHVAYVNGVPVDANGNEVKGAPPEPKSTDNSQLQAMASLNVEERSAAILANALAVALGKAPAHAENQATADNTEQEGSYTLAELPDHLATISDVAELKAMKRSESRKGGKEMIAARITELEA